MGIGGGGSFLGGKMAGARSRPLLPVCCRVEEKIRFVQGQLYRIGHMHTFFHKQWKDKTIALPAAGMYNFKRLLTDAKFTCGETTVTSKLKYKSN
jgi:hypothetical protein